MNIVQVLGQPPDKEFVKYCNSLRCPLCGSQLDGNIQRTLAQLYCVFNNDEYKCSMVPDYQEPLEESIKYWYPQYEYIIRIHRWSNGQYATYIDRFSADVMKIYKESTRVQLFDLVGPRILFFRQRMEEDVFLKKLKTYMVFS